MSVASQFQSTLQLFDQVALERPNALAVVHEDRELSYSQLKELSGRFAAALQNQGVKPGDSIGLCIDRCPEAIAAMFGVFRAGAVFVPLDPEYPPDRIQFMIEDAEIQTIVTHGKADNPLASQMDEMLDINWVDSRTIEFADLNVPIDFCQEARIQADDLAYIMYTSGSTGRPKGVQIEHRALTTYCLADIEAYRLASSDRTLQFSTLNFDIAIEEIFPPLLIGSCVVIRPSERSNDSIELSSIVEKYEVTALHLATAYWHEWVDLMLAARRQVPESLRLVIATGEKVSVQHYRRWLDLCEKEVLWCNAYGPTEATVSSTVFIPDANFDDDNMPIGKVLPGYSAFILNDQLEPVSEGETGQLFIGGPGLARGYLNRDDLTAKAFLQVDLPHGRERIYRTGDLARWLPNENIEFAGRIDHQIKLGSYRIEPGEIEAAINKHSDVLESLVIYEEIAGQKFLIAYVACGDHTLCLSELTEFLRQGLPPYMIPPRYCLVDHFPKTINGKIDRESLPSPSQSLTAAHGSYEAPRNELESKLAQIWESVLQIPQIGIHDDFFELGGSSLLVTRVVSELTSEFSIELPVRDFFANPTVASSARQIRALMRSDDQIDLEASVKERTRRRSRLPIVNAEYIGRGERQLFSVRYSPQSGDPKWKSARRHGVVLCHALGHEYTRAYRNLQQLALMLCSDGFEVLRFDYFGTGNSAGRYEDFRVESLEADLRHAVEHFVDSTDIEDVSLVGIRIGATIAARTQFECPISKIVIWDPVFDGSHYVTNLAALHSYALESQTRFPTPKSTDVDQLFGHRWNDEKRSSFHRLKLKSIPTSGLERLLVASENYLSDELGAQAPAVDWPIEQTRDEIYWHRPEFTERAFSSPKAYQSIVNFLGSSNIESQPKTESAALSLERSR